MTWLVTLQAACNRTSQEAVAQAIGYSQATVSLVLRGKYMSATDRIEQRVHERLAEAPWLAALRAEVQRTNGERAAQRLALSAATVSQVLSGTYKASTLRIERRVRGVLLRETCECPVLFDLPLHMCQDIQERPAKRISNPMHTQAWFACRGQGRFDKAGPCPHFNCGAHANANTAANAKESAK